jgi:hypothetical protein
MVAGVVVALADVTAEHKHAVGALVEGAHHQLGRDAAGARDAYRADVGRGFYASNASSIRSGVGTPGAEEGDDLGFEIHATLHPDRNPTIPVVGFIPDPKSGDFGLRHKYSSSVVMPAHQ